MFYCVGRRAPIVWRQSSAATAPPVTPGTMKPRAKWRVEGRRTHSFRTPFVVYGYGGVTPPPSQTLKTRPRWVLEGRRAHVFREPAFSYGALSSPLPVSLIGTVPAQVGALNVFFSLDLASYFSGTLTPFAYSQIAGALPAGLTRTGSVISGVPSVVGVTTGLIFRATDTGANTADTNAFGFIILEVAARLGGFEYATDAKSTVRKPVYLKRLQQRTETIEPTPPVKNDAAEEIEKKGARMLLAKKGEQSLDPLVKKWLAEKPKLARGADPRATFIKRVRSRIAEMMDDDDSLSTFL